MIYLVTDFLPFWYQPDVKANWSFKYYFFSKRIPIQNSYWSLNFVLLVYIVDTDFVISKFKPKYIVVIYVYKHIHIHGTTICRYLYFCIAQCLLFLWLLLTSLHLVNWMCANWYLVLDTWFFWLLAWTICR